MGFLDKIKALFFGTEKDRDEAIKDEPNRNQILTGEACYWCSQPIAIEDRIKFNKRWFHKKCRRQMIKEVKKDLVGYG